MKIAKIAAVALLPVIFSAFSSKDMGIVIERDRHFVGEALYGFMNGGSELYLEYGFMELHVLELTYQGEEFSVEIYKMPAPEEAFGIYSVHTFRCMQADTRGEINCHSPYQLQSVVGNRYISIVYRKPVQEINEKAVALLDILTRDMEKTRLSFPQELRMADEKVSGKLKYFKGKIALNNAAPKLVSLMEGLDGFSLWSYGFSPESSRIFVKLRDEEQRKLLESRLSIDYTVVENENALLFEM